MATPDLFLRTAYVMTDEGRIASTREPTPERGPLFTIVRGPRSCAWAVHKDVPDDLARELDRTASNEPSHSVLEAALMFEPGTDPLRHDVEHVDARCEGL